MLILTFDKEQLPEKIMAACYVLEVQPSPRHCFRCQNLDILDINAAQNTSSVRNAPECMKMITVVPRCCSNTDRKCVVQNADPLYTDYRKLLYSKGRRVAYKKYNKITDKSFTPTAKTPNHNIEVHLPQYIKRQKN